MPRKWNKAEIVNVRLNLSDELLKMFKEVLKFHNIDTASANEGLRFLIRQEYKRITSQK